MTPTPPQPPEPPVGRSWLLRLNGFAAVALVLVLLFVPNHAYLWFIGHRVFAPLVMLVGLPVGAYLFHRWDVGRQYELLLPWIGAAVVLLIFVGYTAVSDANHLNYENCWKIRGNDASSVWECAPGRSHPAEWPYSYDPNTDDEQTGRFCEFVNETSSGGTIWHCNSD